MKKTFALLILLLSISVAKAQIQEGSHVDRLYEYAHILRTSPGKYETVKEMMSKDSQWTMMTEFTYNCTDESVLCTWEDDFDYCALRDICYQIETARGTMTGNTANLFCNGNDPNYSYSIDELVIKAGMQMQSSLSYREGKQHFLVIPYDYNSRKHSSGLTVIMTYKGEDIQGVATERGFEFVIDRVFSAYDVIKICVTNTTDQNLSFIFINHNSRK